MEQGLRNIVFFDRFFYSFIFSNRTSSVILIRHDQTGLFIEKTLSNPLINPLEWTEHIWSFKLNNVNEPPVLIN
jgi:hypothetical protein